jgi:hypothetical protein
MWRARRDSTTVEVTQQKKTTVTTRATRFAPVASKEDSASVQKEIDLNIGKRLVAGCRYDRGVIADKCCYHITGFLASRLLGVD